MDIHFDWQACDSSFKKCVLPARVNFDLRALNKNIRNSWFSCFKCNPSLAHPFLFPHVSKHQRQRALGKAVLLCPCTIYLLSSSNDGSAGFAPQTTTKVKSLGKDIFVGGWLGPSRIFNLWSSWQNKWMVQHVYVILFRRSCLKVVKNVIRPPTPTPLLSISEHVQHVNNGRSATCQKEQWQSQLLGSSIIFGYKHGEFTSISLDMGPLTFFWDRSWYNIYISWYITTYNL